MKKSRITGALALALAVLFVLSACGGVTGGSASASGGQSGNAALFNPTGYPIVNEPVTISVLCADHGNGVDRSEQFYSQRKQEATGITVEWTAVPVSAYAERRNLLLAANDLPDVFWSGIDVTSETNYGVNGGALIDLTGLVSDYMPILNKYFDANPGSRDVMKAIDGKMYSLPQFVSTLTGGGVNLYVRTDLRDKAGVHKNPSTIGEFYDTLVAMAGIAPDFVPMAVTNILNVEPFLFPSFGEQTEFNFADDGSGNVIYNTTSDQYRHYLEFMANLYAEKLLDNEMFTREAAEVQAMCRENRVGFSNQGTIYTLDHFESGTYDVECFPPLTSEFTDTVKMRRHGHKATNIGFFAITSANKYPEASARWIDMDYWLEEEDLVPGITEVMCWLGPKGLTWERMGDGYYRQIIPEDTQLSASQYLAYAAPGDGAGTLVIMDAPYPTDGVTGMVMKAINQRDHYYPYMVAPFPDGYLRYNDAEMGVISGKMTDIDSYVTQMKARFITGEVPLVNDSWDTFVKEIKAMGIDDVIAVKQASYNRMK